jgi:hypothetical protein
LSLPGDRLRSRDRFFTDGLDALISLTPEQAANADFALGKWYLNIFGSQRVVDSHGIGRMHRGRSLGRLQRGPTTNSKFNAESWQSHLLTNI